jgi:hypothetical protein
MEASLRKLHWRLNNYDSSMEFILKSELKEYFPQFALGLRYLILYVLG